MSRSQSATAKSRRRGSRKGGAPSVSPGARCSEDEPSGEAARPKANYFASSEEGDGGDGGTTNTGSAIGLGLSMPRAAA